MLKKLIFFSFSIWQLLTANPFSNENFGMMPDFGSFSPDAAEMDGFDPSDFMSQMGSIMQSPEGFAQFQEIAGQAIHEMTSDPEILKQNPELAQLRQSLEADPDALKGYLEDFRNVMSDPAQAQALFSEVGNMMQELPEEPFLEELAAEQIEPKAQQPEKPASKNDFEIPKKVEDATQIPTLTQVEISGSWQKILLDRKAPVEERLAAMHHMAADFNKNYKKIYQISHAVDVTQKHLGQRLRKKVLDLMLQPEALADFAAGVWSITGDEATLQLFLEKFSKDNLLEELVDLHKSITELAKVAKLSAEDRLKEDQTFEEGNIPKLYVGHERELEARASTTKDFIKKIYTKLNVDFLQNPKIKETLKANAAKARQGNLPQPRKLPPLKSSMSQGQFDQRGNYGNYSNPYDYPYESSYGKGRRNEFGQNADGSRNARSGASNSSQGAKSREFSSFGSGKKAKDAEKKTEQKPHKEAPMPTELENLFEFLKQIASMEIAKNYIEFCLKSEQLYNLLEQNSANINNLIAALKLQVQSKKPKDRQETGGLVIAKDKKTPAEKPGDPKKTDSEEKNKQTNFSKQDLSLALTGLQRCKIMLDTKFAFSLSPTILKANDNQTILPQPPRPQFYFIEDGKAPASKKNLPAEILKDTLKAEFEKLSKPQEFKGKIEEFAKTLINGKDFIEKRKRDFAKLESAFLLAGASNNSKSVEQALAKNFGLLTAAIDQQLKMPGKTFNIFTHINFSQVSSIQTLLSNKELDEYLKNLAAIIEVGLKFKYALPLEGIQKIQMSMHTLLQNYAAEINELTNKTDSTKLLKVINDLVGKVTAGADLNDAEKNLIKFLPSAMPILDKIVRFATQYTQASVIWENPTTIDTGELLQEVETLTGKDLKEKIQAAIQPKGWLGWIWSYITAPLKWIGII